MIHEDKHRQLAKVFLRRVNEARKFFGNHKPSIGYVGENLLRKSFRSILPRLYGICQGFVIYDGEISRQCDIIIYKKNQGSIHKSYGELKIVNAESVVVVIEVKSSISKETYHSTLKAFEKLYTLRVTNCFLFVYGQLSRMRMSNWLFSYKYLNLCAEQCLVTNSYLYDYPDMEWLPNSVLALESNRYFKLGHISADDGDWFGYTALNIKDSKDASISCLQEFFSDIVMLVNNDEIPMNVKNFSIETGIKLLQF